MKRKWQIIIGIMLIAFFVLMALAAPVLAPNDPDAANLAMKNGAPCPEYPLGCDQMGRCELSRLLYGARYSLGLSIPILAVLAAFALFAGSFSCYQGGMIDEMVRLICDIWMAFPLLVIAMALAASFENPAACMIDSNPDLIMYPGICLLVCCAGFNLLGEGLGDSIGKEDHVSGT